MSLINTTLHICLNRLLVKLFHDITCGACLCII